MHTVVGWRWRRFLTESRCTVQYSHLLIRYYCITMRILQMVYFDGFQKSLVLVLCRPSWQVPAWYYSFLLWYPIFDNDRSSKKTVQSCKNTVKRTEGVPNSTEVEVKVVFWYLSICTRNCRIVEDFSVRQETNPAKTPPDVKAVIRPRNDCCARNRTTFEMGNWWFSQKMSIILSTLLKKF